ncbi:MAG: OmpA family protein [Flavobacteriaceae bacterium]|nr:OmpA family protein [Flavobacteriaceae bacterium]
MKKILFLFVLITISSCVSKKQHTELESRYDTQNQALINAKANLQKCLLAKTGSSTRVTGLDEQIAMLKNQVSNLESQNKNSLQQVENLTVLTKGASDNIKTVIAQLSEKDKYINGIRDAMTKKDSINLAVAFHLKRELADGIQDEDIQVDVEKTVVYISLSDKLMFSSGGATVSPRAKEILGKVATVIRSRPDMEVMVEGHTDNVGISTSCMKDNWDLSTKRSTAVVRVLQDVYNISPDRLVASGRSEFVPLESNNTTEGKARNRRTKIIILPKLDQFFDILEQKPE